MNVSGSLEPIRHIRTVHFALLTLCVLGLLSTTSNTGSIGQKAIVQIDKIQTICRDWTKWSVKFATQETYWLLEYEPGLGGVTWDMWKPEFFVDPAFISPKYKKRNQGMVLQFADALPFFFLKGRFNKNGNEGDLLILAHFNGLEFVPNVSPGVFPRTLGSFREFWRKADAPQLQLITELADSVSVIAEDGTVIKIPYQYESKWEGQFGGKISDGQCTEEHRKSFDPLLQNKLGHFVTPLCGTFNNLKVIYQIRHVHYRIRTNLQTWLGKEFGFSTTGKTFAESFPELHKMTDEYDEAMQIDNVAEFLDKQIDGSQEKIQFIGLSIPTSKLSKRGVIAIFLTQFYLWLNLIAFGRKSGPELNNSYFPWIGLYPGFWAQTSTLITICPLPVFVSLKLVLLAPAGFISWISLMPGTVVAVISWRCLRLLSRPR